MNSFCEFITNPDWWIIVLTIINIGAFIFVAYTQIKLQKKQTKLQQNDLRIQLHKDFFAIYEALEHDVEYILGMGNIFLSQHTFPMDECALSKVNLKAKQILPRKEYEIVESIIAEYSNFQSAAENLFKNHKALPMSQSYSRGNAALTESGFVAFLDAYAAKQPDYTNPNVETCKFVFNKIEQIKNSGFMDSIRAYSNLSDILP